MPDDMVLVPKTIFRAPLESALKKLSKPPTRRTSATRLRKTKPMAFPASMLQEELSTANGLPEAAPEAGLTRRETGEVAPTTATSTRTTLDLKLQDPALVKTWTRFEKRFPSRGLGSVMLQLSEAAERRGRRAKRATMLAGPVLLRFVGPVALTSLPKLTVSSNTVMMDENADVTFGCTEYPASVRACRSHIGAFGPCICTHTRPCNSLSSFLPVW